MIVLNRPFVEMHPGCSIRKSGIIFLSLILSLCSSACLFQKELYTLGEWIQELTLQAGIENYKKETSYFEDVPISHPYFAEVQSAVEWGVLEQNCGFDPDLSLTREWVCYTLMNLSMETPEKIVEIKDLKNSQFPQQVQNAVSMNLLELDSSGYFEPKKEISKEDAFESLSKMIEVINNRTFESKTDIVWDMDQIMEVFPDAIDSQNNKLYFSTLDTISFTEGNVIGYIDEQGFPNVKQIVSMEESDSNIVVNIKDAENFDFIEQMDVSGSVELDFDQAEILDEDNEIIKEYSALNTVENHLSFMSTKGKQKTVHIGQFDIVIKQNGATLSAEVSKTFPHGSKVYAKAKVNGVKVDYQWKKDNNDMRDAYFKVKCTTEEDFGLSNGSYKNLYGDFSKFSASEFVSSLQSMFVQKKDVVEQTLTLCSIRVPIPSAPVMSVLLSLEMHMNLTGKAELVLKQVNGIGLEYKNGNVRCIKENTNTFTNQVKASLSCTAGIRFALECVKMALMDTSLQAGAKATAKTSFHLYDEDGNHSLKNSSVSSDVADEVADGNPNVLVCVDLDAYPILKIKVNTSKTLLGKMGFDGSFNILSSNNASMFQEKSGHFENGHRVSKCTRGSKITSTKNSDFTVSKKLELDSYNMILSIGGQESIHIVSFPEGYMQTDLIFESSDPSIATVTSDGVITGITKGSCIITIRTYDSKHSIQCNVLVPSV